MYKDILNLLKLRGIEFEKGLTFNKLMQIEKIYNISFPISLKEFLMIAVPISKGFYNWADITDNNINFIKQAINKPNLNIFEMAKDIYWSDNWGEIPINENSIVDEIRKQLNKAPKLLPIYAHRYMPIIQDNNPPIISIHNIDIIYYGENLKDYFKIEFGEKKQTEIDFKNVKYIPFWSDMM